MKKLLLFLMVFCSNIVCGYEWNGMYVKLWSEMTDQEILEEYSIYKQYRTFYCEITKGGINYTVRIDGYTYSWLSALDGVGAYETPERFLGIFRLSDKPGIIPIQGGVTWNETTIYDEDGIKHAREVVFKEWKKQFMSAEAALAPKTDGYSGRITIPEKVTVSKLDQFPLSYVEDSYYNDYYNKSVNLQSFAKAGGGDLFLSGSFKVTSVSQFNASEKGLISVSFPQTIEDFFPSLEWCVNLESLNISRKAISMPSVVGCKKLKYINYTGIRHLNLPSTLEKLSSFAGCETIDEIVIPDKVTKLDANHYWHLEGDTYLEYCGCFDGCTNLKSIIIGSGVKELHSYMCRNCTSLENIVIGKNVTIIPSYMFQNCINLKSFEILKQVTSIGDYAFDGCTNLEEITFEDDSNLEEICQSAFRSCIKIKQISLPVPLKSIYSGAFENCSALEVLVLPSSLEFLGYGIVSGCVNLLDIYAHMSVPFEIDSSVFYDYSGGIQYIIYCDTYLHVPDGKVASYRKTDSWSMFTHITSSDSPLHTIPTYGVRKRITIDGLNYVINKYSKTAMLVAGNYSEKKSVDIPSSITWNNELYLVTEISGNVFYNCKNLLTATLSKNLKDIGKEAFAESCVAGETADRILVFPEGLETIGDRAYYFCTRIHEIDLPSTLKSIGENAFKRTDNLKKVVSKMKTPIAVPDNAFSFDNFSEEEIPLLYVPVGSKPLYEAMDCWKKFKIVEMSTSEEPAELNVGETFESSIDDSWCKFLLTDEHNVTLQSSLLDGRVIIPSTVTYNGVEYTITAIEGAETGISYRPYLNVFVNKNTITEVVIPNTVKRIGAYAFYGCSKMTSLTIGSSVESIGEYAFNDCLSLVSITWGTNLKTIDKMAFNCVYDSELTEVTIPNGVEEIGRNAFCMKSLRTVTLPPSIKKLSYAAFSNWQTSEMTVNISDLTAFSNIEVLTDVSDGFCFGYYRLYLNNAEVINLAIPNNISKVGQIYSGCISLKSLKFHQDVSKIAKVSFYGCKNITKVIALSKMPINISGTVRFDEAVMKNAMLFVPEGSTSAYRSAGWNFTNIDEFLLGDANGDGDVDQNDLKLVREYIMTGNEPIKFVWQNADTSGDNMITVADIVNIVNLIRYQAESSEEYLETSAENE